MDRLTFDRARGNNVSVLQTLFRKFFVVVTSAAIVVAVGASTQGPAQLQIPPAQNEIYADFNGDGVLDVLRQPGQSDAPVEMLLYSDGSRSLQIDYAWEASSLGVDWSVTDSRLIPGDFDGNGRDDVFVQSLNGSRHAMLLSDVNGQFSEVAHSFNHNEIRLNAAGIAQLPISGDFNGDGRDDLLVRSSRSRVGTTVALFDERSDVDASNSWVSDWLDVDWRTTRSLLSIGQFNGQDGDGRYSDDLALVSRASNDRSLVTLLSIDRELQPFLLDTMELDLAYDRIGTVQSHDTDGNGIAEIVLLDEAGRVLAILVPNTEGKLTRQDLSIQVPQDLLSENSQASQRNEVTPKQSSARMAQAPASDATGTMPGGLSVANGAALYRIPIDVPPGRNGMAPDLALEYNSRYTNGIMGVGWKISGLSSIERCNASIAHDSESLPVSWSLEDRLCLDGKRLKHVAGARGASGSEYRTEIDEYARIKLDGASTSNTSKIVYEARNGRTLTYGGTASSRIYVPGRTEPLGWALSRVEDRHGNYMDFKYTTLAPVAQSTTEETHVIDEIVYTLPNTGTQRSVKFNYETTDRSDVVQTFKAGYQRIIHKRLLNITTYVGTSVVRTYTPHYSQSTATGRSLVDYVQLCATDADGESCLPASSFTYDQDAPTFTVDGNGFSGLATGPVFQANSPAVDLNGDGRDDLVEVNEGSVRVWWGQANGFSSADDVDLGDFAINAGAKVSGNPTMDWNQDGRTDYTFPLADLTDDQPPPPTNLELAGVEDPLGEVDADGNLIVEWDYDPAQLPDVYFKVTRESFPGIPVVTDVTGNPTPISLAVNGLQNERQYTFTVQACNLGDVCSNFAESPSATVVINIIQGGGGNDCQEPCNQTMRGQVQATSKLGVLWFDAAGVASVEETDIDIEVDADFPSYYTLDVNGDGRQDVVTRFNNNWNVYLRSPNSTNLVFVPGGTVPVDNDQAAQVVDYNGDGRFDLLLERPSLVGDTSFNRLLLSEGNSFSVIPNALANSVISANNSALVTRPLFADIDNDGLTDAIINNANNTQLSFVSGLGAGWVSLSTQQVNPPPNTPAGEYLTFAVRVLDVDGDGDLDLLRPTTPATGTTPDPVELNNAYHWEVVPFNGVQFDEAAKYNFTDTSGPGLILGNWVYADIYGDGIIDVIATKGGETLGDSGVTPIVVTNSVEESDVMTVASNGLGFTQEIEYASINDSAVHHQTASLISDDLPTYPNATFTGAFKVVSALHSTHGANEPTPGKDTTTIRYEYWNARMDREGRGFLGFEQIREEQVDLAITTDSLYYLSFPRTGRMKQSTTYISGENVSAGEFITQSTYTWSDDETASITNPGGEQCFWEFEVGQGEPQWVCETFPPATYPASWSVYSSVKTEVTKEPNDSYAVVGTLNETNEVDIYGNLTKKTSVSSDTQTIVTRVVEQSVDEDVTAWWVNKIVNTKIEDEIQVLSAPFPTTSGWTAPVSGVVTNSSTRYIKRIYYEDQASGCDATHREVCEIRIDPEVVATDSPSYVDSGSEERRIKLLYDAYGNVRSTTVSDGPNVTGDAAFTSRTQTATHSGIPQFYFTGSYKNALDHETAIETNRQYGQTTKLTYPNQSTLSYTYDAFGRVAEIDTSATEPVVVNYLSCVGVAACPALAAYRVTVTQNQGANSEHYYDKLGREIGRGQEGFASGSTISTTVNYDYLGRMTSASEPFYGSASTHSTVYSMFDTSHRPQKVVTPTGEEQTYVFNALSTTVKRKTSNWNNGSEKTLETTYGYNSLGWLHSVKDALNGFSYYRYDSQGNLAYSRDPELTVTQMAFDRRSRQTELFDPNNGDWSYGYDALDQQIEVRRHHTASTFDSIEYDYDVLGRQVSRTETQVGGAAALVGQWTYDVNLNPDSYGSDPVANYTGRLSRVTGSGRSSGYEKIFAYDGQSRLLRSRSNFTVDGSPQTFDNEFDYDAFGRSKSVTYPSGYSVELGYNARGYLDSETDGAGQALRSITGYSPRNQIAAQDFGSTGNLSGSYAYSPASGLVTNKTISCTGATCDQGTIQNLTYTYDDFNLLRSRQKGALNPVAKETFTEYDDLMRLKSSTVKLGATNVQTTVQSYSAAGNINSKNDFASQYSYDEVRNAGPHGVTSVSLINSGGTLDYGYDLHGNITSVTPINGASTEHTKTAVYTIMNKPNLIVSGGEQSEAFTYSPDDQRWRQETRRTNPTEEESRTTLYVDGLYELVKHTNDEGDTVTEERHFVGDYMVHTTVSSADTDGDGIHDHEDNCRLVSNPTQYDANADGIGNICDQDLNDDGIVNFTDSALFATYYDTPEPIADFNADGWVNFLDLVRFQSSFQMPPGPAALGNFGEGDNYLLTDNLGSVDTVVTEQGDIIERFGYTPFGKRIGSDWVSDVLSASPSGFMSSASQTTTSGFTGHEHLDESGWIHMNGRVFDPDLARFSSADPIIADLRNSQSQNAYSYVWNSPVNGTDPSGYEAVVCMGVAQCALVSSIIASFTSFLANKLQDPEPEEVNAKYQVSRQAPQANTGSHSASSAHTNNSVSPSQVYGPEYRACMANSGKTGTPMAGFCIYSSLYEQGLISQEEFQQYVNRNTAASAGGMVIAGGVAAVATVGVATAGTVVLKEAGQAAVEEVFPPAAVIPSVRSVAKNGAKQIARRTAIREFPNEVLREFGRSLTDLRKAAFEPINSTGLTRAARALDKHASGQRGSGTFPRLSGNTADRNRQAQEIVDKILNDPESVFKRLGRGGLEIRSPNGRGLRFDKDGTFSGFVD